MYVWIINSILLEAYVPHDTTFCDGSPQRIGAMTPSACSEYVSLIGATPETQNLTSFEEYNTNPCPGRFICSISGKSYSYTYTNICSENDENFSTNYENFCLKENRKCFCFQTAPPPSSPPRPFPPPRVPFGTPDSPPLPAPPPSPPSPLQ